MDVALNQVMELIGMKLKQQNITNVEQEVEMDTESFYLDEVMEEELVLLLI
jgi:hypothetical protein